MPAPSTPNATARNLWITQYLVNPDTGEELLNLLDLDVALSKYKSIHEWIYVVHQEDADDPNGRHVHLMLRFVDKGHKVSQIERWMNVPWQKVWPIKTGRGTPTADAACAQVLDYFFHLDPAGEGKRRYGPDDAVASDGFDWQGLMRGHPSTPEPKRSQKLSPRGRILSGKLSAQEAINETTLTEDNCRKYRGEFLAKSLPPASHVGVYVQASALYSDPLVRALTSQYGPAFTACAALSDDYLDSLAADDTRHLDADVDAVPDFRSAPVPPTHPAQRQSQSDAASTTTSWQRHRAQIQAMLVTPPAPDVLAPDWTDSQDYRDTRSRSDYGDETWESWDETYHDEYMQYVGDFSAWERDRQHYLDDLAKTVTNTDDVIRQATATRYAGYVADPTDRCLSRLAEYDGEPVVVWPHVRSSLSPAGTGATVWQIAAALGGPQSLYASLTPSPAPEDTGRVIDTAAGQTQLIPRMTVLVGEAPWEDVRRDLAALFAQATVDDPDSSSGLSVPMILPVTETDIGVQVLDRYVTAPEDIDTRSASQYVDLARVPNKLAALHSRTAALPSGERTMVRAQGERRQLVPVMSAEEDVRARIEHPVIDGDGSGADVLEAIFDGTDL